MKVTSILINMTSNALIDSLNVELMSVITDKVIPGYDIYKTTGFPENIPIPKKDAARQILSDIKKENRFQNFNSPP